MYKIKDIINKIICGDALSELKKIGSESIDMCITSPPYYGLRNYNVEGQLGLENSFGEYLEKLLEIIAEIKRVLKKEGSFWLNMGDCYGGLPAGNKSISEANIGTDSVYVRKMKQCQGAKSFVGLDKFGGNIKTSTLTNPESLLNKGRAGKDKCLLMQPERLAIRMIDEQGWILRNKIKWSKQVLIKKENRTIGSVMPTSVKDRFNESGEELYFFVKKKKYYSDLNSVRIPNQIVGVTDMRDAGILRQRMYPESKYNKFNYRVRDAERKKGQPQFRATEEEIKRYKGKFTNKQDHESFGSPKARTQRNKVNDPRGNHLGGPGSWRDNLDDKEYRKKWKEQKDPISKRMLGIYGDDRKGSRRSRVREFQDNHRFLDTHTAGKNIPTIWQINSEPHKFEKELGIEGVDHFAVFPQALLDIPIKFGSPKNGIILDPFMGSGTTALVAKKLGRNYIGIELNDKYVKLTESRIGAIPQSLFS